MERNSQVYVWVKEVSSIINPIKVQFTIQIDNGRTNNITLHLLADPTILGM